MTTFGLDTTSPGATSDVTTAAAPTTARRPMMHGPMTLARNAIHAPSWMSSGIVADSEQLNLADCDSTTLLPILIGPLLSTWTSSPIQQSAPTRRFHGEVIRTRCRIRTPGSIVAPQQRSAATRTEFGTNASPMIRDTIGQLSDMR